MLCMPPNIILISTIQPGDYEIETISLNHLIEAADTRQRIRRPFLCIVVILTNQSILSSKTENYFVFMNQN
jgi:hypothetical protein